MKKSHRVKKLSRLKISLYVVVVIGLLAAVYFTARWVGHMQQQPVAQLYNVASANNPALPEAAEEDQPAAIAAQPATDPVDYTSLDLRIAAKAIYSGSAIEEVSQLGVTNNIQRTIISFPVKIDKLTEYGLMTMPTTRAPAGGFPVIILLHGYVQPETYSTTNAYLSQMEFYSQHGFVVIKPDLRGQGLTADVGQPEGAYYSMAYNRDVMSLIASVKDTGWLNANDINLWGHSMGAYLALRAAVLSPTIKNVILLSGPVGTVQDMFNDYTPTSDINNPVAFAIRQKVILSYGTPVSNPSFWDNTSPLSFLQDSKAYIQIHVGTADRTVPPKFSEDLNSALNKLNRPHGYYVYVGGNHGLGAQMTQILDTSLQVLQSTAV